MARATLIQRRRAHFRQSVFVEIVIWSVPAPLRGSAHGFKYSLALVSEGECVLRYDNEAGKGDHKHLGAIEMPLCIRDHGSIAGGFRRGRNGMAA